MVETLLSQWLIQYQAKNETSIGNEKGIKIKEVIM
jgi:hypothetical protein